MVQSNCAIISCILFDSLGWCQRQRLQTLSPLHCGSFLAGAVLSGTPWLIQYPVKGGAKDSEWPDWTCLGGAVFPGGSTCAITFSD
jgi:hypothetical protein